MSEITEVLAAMQDQQKDMVAATRALLEHNVDLTAHADIREKLQQLIDSDAIYTRTEINALIAAGLKEHADKAFDVAHPGWDAYNKENQGIIASLTTKVEALTKRLDAASGTGDMTDLERQLQAVENKYAPILAALQTTFAEAEKNGQTVLAEEYKSTIATTLQQKTTDLLAVMTAWQSTHTV